MMIILFVTLFSYHEPILCYRVISGYYKSRPSLITYILINFPNMFYIFHVSILDFDVKKNNLLLWFLAIDPTQSVSNVFFNMYSFCYEAVITVNFIILQLVQNASIQYASFGAKLWMQDWCACWNKQLLRVRRLLQNT